ncbi:MAG: hypothetical protein AAGE89_06380 [Pseudomonadota bacterium]
MHFNTRIDLIEWREGIRRPGLSGPYREAIFRISSDGMQPIEVSIFVHPAWPEDDQEKVARSFLHARLREGLQALDIYDPAELEALWRKVKPEDISIPEPSD